MSLLLCLRIITDKEVLFILLLLKSETTIIIVVFMYNLLSIISEHL